MGSAKLTSVLIINKTSGSSLAKNVTVPLIESVNVTGRNIIYLQ
jgi:hypothetical protein